MEDVLLFGWLGGKALVGEEKEWSMCSVWLEERHILLVKASNVEEIIDFEVQFWRPELAGLKCLSFCIT